MILANVPLQPGPVGPSPSGRRRPCIFAVLAAVCLAGCRKDEIQVYTIPKEKAPPAAAAAVAASSPNLKWTKPAGWEDREAGTMRLARFAVVGQEGQEADVSIIPMSGMKASRADLVNLWRSQVQLEAASAEVLAKSAETAAIGPASGELYDMVSSGLLVRDKFKLRIMVAVLTQGENVWAFKLAGTDELVRAQKPQFLEFLKSITFVEAASLPAGHPPIGASETGVAAKAPPVGAGSEASPARPQWTVPPGWQELPATQMLLAKFVAKGEGESRADISVSFFPGETGGLLANVNRWRGQLELDMVEEKELKTITQPLDLPGSKAILVDMIGTDAKTRGKARLLGAVVPRGGQTWFFKMIGDEKVAEREKAAFLKFIQSVRFPDA